LRVGSRARGSWSASGRAAGGRPVSAAPSVLAACGKRNSLKTTLFKFFFLLLLYIFFVGPKNGLLQPPPTYFLRLVGIPHRIPDYSNAYTGWNVSPTPPMYFLGLLGLKKL
jgi:hypothetical protein